MPTSTLSLLYVPTTPPRRNPSARARYELTCEPRGEGWSVRAPGVFTARGEVFTPEPEFIDGWLRGAVAPFGAVAGDGEHLLPSEAQFRAFVSSLEPVLCGTSAHADLDRLVAVFPGDAALLLERAQEAARLQRPLPEVAKDVTAALALRADAETLLTASYVHHQAGDRAGAIVFVQRVLAQVPAHEEAASQYLVLLELDGRSEEWLVVEETRGARRARGPMEWNRRAGVFERLNRFDEAAHALAQSLTLRDDAVSRVRRGKLLARLGRDEEALAELDAGLARCADLDGHLVKAEVLTRRGAIEDAVKTLKWVAQAASHRAIAEERLQKLVAT